VHKLRSCSYLDQLRVIQRCIEGSGFKLAVPRGFSATARPTRRHVGGSSARGEVLTMHRETKGPSEGSVGRGLKREMSEQRGRARSL
jgi:hypothetical protein